MIPKVAQPTRKRLRPHDSHPAQRRPVHKLLGEGARLKHCGDAELDPQRKSLFYLHAAKTYAAHSMMAEVTLWCSRQSAGRDTKGER